MKKRRIFIKSKKEELSLSLTQLYYMELKEGLKFEFITAVNDSGRTPIEALSEFPDFIDLSIRTISELEAESLVIYPIPKGIEKYNQYRKLLIREINKRKDLVLLPVKDFPVQGVVFSASHNGVTLGDIIMDVKKIVTEINSVVAHPSSQLNINCN